MPEAVFRQVVDIKALYNRQRKPSTLGCGSQARLESQRESREESAAKGAPPKSGAYCSIASPPDARIALQRATPGGH